MPVFLRSVAAADSWVIALQVSPLKISALELSHISPDSEAYFIILFAANLYIDSDQQCYFCCK